MRFLLKLSTIVSVFILGSPICAVELDTTGDKGQVKVAVCYWGLTRSTKYVYPTHFTCIFDVLTEHNIAYDVYLHTWEIPSGPQRVQGNTVDIPVDYEEYSLLKPTYFVRDNQESFTKDLEWEQYSCGMGWTPVMILNHFCALESLNRVTDMVINSGNEYDFIMYVRPDVCFLTKLNTKDFINLKDNQVAIPDFDHFGGYNDRFAILPFPISKIYGKRIESLPLYGLKKPIHSETFVKDTLDENELEVVLMDDFRFVRVRPDGAARPIHSETFLKDGMCEEELKVVFMGRAND